MAAAKTADPLVCRVAIYTLCVFAGLAISAFAAPPIVSAATIKGGGFDGRGQPVGGRRAFDINGRIRVETMSIKLSQIKIVLNGGERVTFPKQDGYFTFVDVPAGTHLLEVVAMGYFFVPVRVDVSPRFKGHTRASWMTDVPIIEEGMMVIQPLQAVEYYDRREPFSLSSMLKNPMVLMVSFMVVAMFLLPRLVENMDPEAMRELQSDVSQHGNLVKTAIGKDI